MGFLALSIAAATLPSQHTAPASSGGLRLPSHQRRRPQASPRLPLPRFTFAPYLQDVTTDGASSFCHRCSDGSHPAPAARTPPVDTPAEPHAATASVDRADAAGPASPLSLPLADGRGCAGPSPSALQLQSAMAVRHRLRINGLHPGSRYRYEVTIRRVSGPGPTAQTSDGVSLAGELTTAPTSGSFLFLVYGDTRDRDADHASVVQAMVNEHPTSSCRLATWSAEPAMSCSGDGILRRRLRFCAMHRFIPRWAITSCAASQGGTLPAPVSAAARSLAPPAAGVLRVPLQQLAVHCARRQLALRPAASGLARAAAQRARRRTARCVTCSSLSTSRRTPSGAYCGSQRLQQRIVPILQRYGCAPSSPVTSTPISTWNAGRALLRHGWWRRPAVSATQSHATEDDTALWMFRAEHHYLRVQVDGDQAVATAVDRRGTIMERVALHEPPGDAPLLHQLSPDLPTPSPRPRWLLPARLQRVPLLSMSKDPRESTDGRPAGALVLLGLSSITVLAGLWVLIRPGQRRRRARPRTVEQGGRLRHQLATISARTGCDRPSWPAPPLPARCG